MAAQIEKVRDGLARSWSKHDIARKRNIPLKAVHELVWRVRNYDRYTAAQRRWAETSRRARGMRPLSEISADAIRKWKRIKPLLAKGKTYSEIGAILGMTRNMVAGTTHKARHCWNAD